MKDYRNIESNRAPRDLESRRHGPWRGWINRHFAKRLFSMLVVVCLLSNTLGLVVDDINAAQTRLASAEILEINPEPFAFAEDLETDTSLADAYDDALDQLGDLSLSNNLASNAAGDGKTYAYRLEDETRLLLSDLIVKLELPVRQLKDIQSVSLQNNGANTGIDMSLFVAIAEVEDDYLIVLKPLFAEARLTVYTVDGMFNLRLVNDPTLTAEEVAKAAMALSEDPEGFGPLFSCDLRDASSKIRLSALLKRAGLPIKVSDVVDLGVIEHNGKEGQCLTIEKGKKDYRLTVIRSFNEIELAVFTGSKSYTIVLQNGRASDSEQTETDVFDSSLEIPEIDDIGLEDASSGDLIEVSGQNDELGIDIGVDLDVEQVETPVSEAEPEVEQIEEPETEPEAEPEAEPEVEPEQEPETEPEVEPEQEQEAEPEVEQIEESEAEPEVEQIEEPEAAPEQEPEAEPEVEQIEEPEAAPEQEPEAEPEVEQIEEPEAAPEQEPEAEPEIEQIEEPEAAPEQEPEVKPEVEQIEEPEVEPEAEPEIEQIEEPEAAPEQEPEAEPEVEQIEEPEAAHEQEPEAEPEVEQIEEPEVEPEIEQIEEPEAAPEQEPEAEPEVEQIEEPEAAREQEPKAEPEVEQIEEPEAAPEQEPEAEPEVEQIEEPEAAPEQEPEAEPEIEQIEEPEAAPEQEPEAEPEVEQIEEPEAAPEQEPEAEPEIEQIEEPEAAPEQESEVEPESEPVVEPEQEPEAETEAEPTQESGGSDDAESGIRQEAVSSPEATQDGALEIVPEDGAQEEIVSEETPKQESEDEVDDVSAVEPEALPEVEPGTEAQTDEPSPEPETAVSWPAASFAARTSGVNVTVTADEGAFPEGTTMSVRRVWDVDALSEIRESVADDFVKVRRVQLVDIAFYDAEGNEIEPRIPVSVVISVSEINDDQSAVVVHMDDEGQTQIVADTDVESASGRTNLNVELPAGDTEPGEVEIEQTEVGVGDVETEISFDADGFSLYAVVVTETISTHYIDASGNTYSVEVSYGPEAGIPSGAKLAVSELEGDEAEAYIGAALEAVENDGNNDANSKKTTLKYAKALDISILMDGVEVRPVAPISVSIKLLDAPNSDEFDEANVVHFGDEAEVVESNIQQEAVRFETDGFSVYVVTYTISTFYMDASGNTYSVEVSYGPEAGIPSGAKLAVSELEGDEAEAYAARAAEALNVNGSQVAYAKTLDISILADGTPVQPQTPVSVSIKLLDAPEAAENTNIDVIHFGDEPKSVSCALEDDAVTFEADGFSVYVVTYTVDFHWGDYTWSIAGESEIMLSALLEQLGVNEIALADVADVSFSNPEYIEIEQAEGDWLLKSLAPFDTEEALTLTLKNGRSVQIVVTDEGTDPAITVPPTAKEGLVYNGQAQALVNEGTVDEGGTLLYAFGENRETPPVDIEGEAPKWSESIPTATDAGTYYVWYKVEGSDPIRPCLTVTVAQATFDPSVTMSAGDYDAQNNTITYTVTVIAEGNSFYEEDHPVTITSDLAGLTFQSGSYTYTHSDTLPEGSVESQVNDGNISAGEASFYGFPLTVRRMYDGDTLTLTYTAEVNDAVYDASEEVAKVKNTVTITPGIASDEPNISTNTENDAATVTTSSIPCTPLKREYLTLDGSWAYWRVTVNPEGYTLGGGKSLRLVDTFDDDYPTKKNKTDAGQAIDYASVKVDSAGSVAYDYSGSTGTFVIPDGTPVTITYRTRITAQPGTAAFFRGTAVLKDADGNEIARKTAGVTDEAVVIYPSPSDVGGLGDNYMLKLYVYANGKMQTGVQGAQFILLDANQRALEYKLGENKGQPVTFTTGADGYVNIELHEEAGDVSIEKNTGYYLEMIKAVDGYQKDNTLYSFMITDDPDYNSGGAWTYFNGDTMKVRLYPASAGLRVSIRFSGSYALSEELQNAVTAVLQKKDGEKWVEVERHTYAATEYGAITFSEPLYDESLGTFQNVYRVVEENQKPWDLPNDINLETTYYCLINSDGSDPETEPQEFFVHNANDSVSVVIDNRYEEPQLTLVKMDKRTGELLAGAEFSVYEIENGAAVGDTVVAYATDADGKLVIRGGEPFVSETLYGIKETKAPEGYLLPLQDEWHYFYFCNDEVLEPGIKANLPEGATAVNLTNNGDRIAIDNQKESIDIPVMKLWQGGLWPEDAKVVVGLYRSVEGGEPQPVSDDDGSLLTVTLTKASPYNNTAFKDLPSRDDQGRNYIYSIKEESIDEKDPLVARYVQEYGVSSGGVYIVRNKPATTLTVSKEWYQTDPSTGTDVKVEDETALGAQSPVTFDVYRSSTPFGDTALDDGVTNAEMTAFVRNLVKVRENLSFGAADGWAMSIDDLDKQDDLGKPYYYYVLETVPSFGNEVYVLDEVSGAVTIKNKVAPNAVNLTVTKAALVDDPRTESLERDFKFTLKLQADETHPIRSWQVYTDEQNPQNNLITDWNGEATFTLKPTNPDPEQQPTPGASITLSLPVGVTATVTEAYNPEYTVETQSNTDTKANNGRTFSYVTGEDAATLTYTNTLHVICKVVTDRGEEKPFESLNSALNYIRQNSTSFTAPWTIYLLEDYTLPATDEVSINEGESLTLTTAPVGADGGNFPFKPPEDDPARTFAVITRGEAGESMLKNMGTLTLANLCLDGAKDNLTATGDGGLVYSVNPVTEGEETEPHTPATLNLKAGTILRNSAVSGKGGAVYAEGTVNIESDTAITGNSAANASALWLKGTLNMSGGSITHNTGAADGAVVVESTGDRINLSGSPVIFDNTNAQNKAANLVIGADSDNIVNVADPGLTENSHIGISAMEGHMLIGEQFATADSGFTQNLYRFTNDTYGYRGKLQDGTSTNIVWDGLTLKIKKIVAEVGANPNERFTITLSSPSIVLSSYIIDGTLDYTIEAAKPNRPGRIVFTNVKAGDEYTISPLPVGDYTISEAASNYDPAYTQKVGEEVTIIEGGAFKTLDDCTVTVTNTRKLTDVNLKKTLSDRLKAADETQEFTFTVKLTEADGTAVSGFTLADGVTTDSHGEATLTLSPQNNAIDGVTRKLRAPVGATMTITETYDPSYVITASAVTIPSEGTGVDIEDQDEDNDNVFAFPVTGDGAKVTFANVRKMANIELSKTLVGKVSTTESYDFTVTLTRADSLPAAGYTMYEDADDPQKSITTGEDGKVAIQFSFGVNESAKSVTLTIPEGTKLEVEETGVNVGHEEWYDTTCSMNGAAATSGRKATIKSVSDSDHSIAFTNTRKTRTVTVKNTVSGYSGNVVPFTFTATVTDKGDGDDYDANGFENGVQTFQLATGQSRTLTVPYGAQLTVAEAFIVGYDTTVKRGSAAADTATKAEFDVTADETLAFTNTQLIGLQIVNNTSSTLKNVQIYVGYGTRMYRVNEAGDGQERVEQTTGRWATISVDAGKRAILEINHKSGITDTQDYTVKGNAPATGYLYTINNEPSYHEYANPAIQRRYNTEAYEVKGQLRYSTIDSIVTFTEQPLVSFDLNGGAWTTEMEDYHWDDTDKLYQMAVTSGQTVAQPDPAPVYPTDEDIPLLGWTTDETIAKAQHAKGEDISAKAYDFNTPVTAPLTLYAVWAKPARDGRVVTVRNGFATNLDVTATLTKNNTPVAGHPIAEGKTTDASGKASFTLPAGASVNLSVPDGAKLVLGLNTSALGVSDQFVDSDTDVKSFTIAAVTRDGTVTFTPGVCKITDGDGNILYDDQGQPAVYTKLSDAFTAYNGTLYTSANHNTPAAQAAVKMLVDEYAIQQATAIAFPNKTMTLTTAGKTDAEFPYVGTRDRCVIYRYGGGNSNSCFNVNNANSNITLTNIVLDGGSELGRKAEQSTNGMLISVSNGTLTVDAGTTMRNSAAKAYADGNWGRGGAIYMTNGTLNVNAGLFSNLHARNGGAIYILGGTLNLSGEDGSTRFEECCAEVSGGAIEYRSSNALTVNGGSDNGFKVDATGNALFNSENKKIEANNPGIVFDSCIAKDSNEGNGGAIFIVSNGTASIQGCSFVECSARVNKNDDRTRGGGAIAAKNVNSLMVSNCTFSACDTLTTGGAVFAKIKDGTSMTVNNSIFRNDSCKGQGGGIGVYQVNENAKTTAQLTVNGCKFENCSSGTQNGSGGAIQSYLPCMSLQNSEFADCWAGKEGGGINNFFGANYTEQWNGSFMTISGCEFTRCRAEDRFQVDIVIHYGGAINTKVKTVNVENSKFVDCVSTLRDGGALHLGGCGTGTSAKIENSTFTGCTAKKHGGAVFSSAETLEIISSKFYGCLSTADCGGAVYHGMNCRSEANVKKETKITECEFKQGCGAAINGSAVWTAAQSAVITNCTIEGCTSGDSGAIYLSEKDVKINTSSNKETGTSPINVPLPSGALARATLTDGSITGCQAKNGSAVYVGHSAIFSSTKDNEGKFTNASLTISGNTVTDVNDGAIHGGKLYFEGNVVVENNTCSGDTVNHDVLLQNNNVTTIYTTENGLANGANIGVYVADTSNAYANRGKEGQAFGTHGSGEGNAFMESFFNDRDEGLYGYQQSGDSYIYWGRYLCKITDAQGNTLKRPNGRDAVYQTLSMALGEFTSVTGGDPVYIKMLVENYDIFQTGQIENFPNADVTLTTAGIDDAEHPYRGREGTVCTISRTNSNNQLFYLNNANATFQLENITLDGRRDKTSEVGNFRLIQADSGNLVINPGTTLQYGSFTGSGRLGGGAVYTKGLLTIHGDYDAENQTASVKFINCINMKDGTLAGTDADGGAIYADRLVIDFNGETDGKHYGTAFINCAAARGGAVCISGKQADVSGAKFENCYCKNEGGAFYHNNNDKASTSHCRIEASAFENCYTVTDEKWSYGGAVNAKIGTLTLDTCSFKNCYARSDGGAINHGVDQGDRVKTEIINTVFDNCRTTGSHNSYGVGGCVYTRAMTVDVQESTFKNTVTYNHGGALYCENSNDAASTIISGTTFENCSVSRTDGIGGAIYSRNKILTIQDGDDSKTSFDSCTALKQSGAIYLEKDDSTLNISGNTLITGCYADQGGAIYLKDKVTLNLTGSPEFARNGYTTRNGSIVNATQGACIYLQQGSRINLSGSPKFSRNILPNVDRITNGGIYDNVRQDIYMAGYQSNTAYDKNAASIHVTGALEGDTIWVWPEQSPHRLPNEQFAKIDTSANSLSDDVLSDTLSHFRNALADSVTSCSNGEFLAGVKIGNDSENVYWDKMYTVAFQKKDNKAVAVPGAEFTLYKDLARTETVGTATSADGESDTDAQGKLLAKGAVEFTSIRIGAYYMKETKVPTSFKDNDTVYLVLVGTPYLQKTENNRALWENGGPLDVDNATTLVPRHTTDAGKYYGIFPLDANGKAILRANLASNSVGIENVRNDYQVAFMKVDGSDAALPGAAFTIYAAAALDDEGQPQTFEDGYPKLRRWSRDGVTYPAAVISADGTSAYRDVNNRTLPKGVVYFRELPIGTYYLLETQTPERNGAGRRTFYAESDRVFKLDIVEDPDDKKDVKVTLSEWKPATESVEAHYEELSKPGNYYIVDNREVVCKLTDASDKLLYTQGHRVWEQGDDATGEGTARLFPAVYATLAEGFEAAQTGTFVYEDGREADVSALKLKVLKDCTIDGPIVYDSNRKITFTTAETRQQKDRYIFTTNRTSDTARALISRAYDEDASQNANAGALITLDDGAEMTLQNIHLNGQEGNNRRYGRAIHVTSGSALHILTYTQIERFRQEAAKESAGNADLKGGAILMDEGASLTIDGGYNRSAVFSDNAVVNNRVEGKTGADGGAIAVGANCTFSITNAQFTRNAANATAGNKGNGGAISINETREAEEAMDLPIRNVVFSSNTANYQGGALRTAEKVTLTVDNCIFQNNAATYGDGGAIAALSKADSATRLTVTGGSFTGNSAGNGNGGAIKIGGYGTLTIQGNPTARGNAATNGGAVYVASSAAATIENGSFTGNNATANGGAVYVASAAGATIKNGSFSGNKATENGGAVYVDAKEAAEEGDPQIGVLTLEGGSLTGNGAKLGGAVYAANHGVVNFAGGSVTGNTASDANGGAINVGGADARLNFSGSPVVFNNTDANGTRSPQRNVVLSEDSNAVINTAEAGLTAGGVVGVYVIDGDNKAIFKGHGMQDTPFGAFGDAAHANPDVFMNDRNLALRAVSKSEDDSTIYWDEVVCKLTDSSDTLLYKEVSVTINGVSTKLYAPAVYKTLEDGFEASEGTLYYMNGTRFTGSSVKVKMLKDYALSGPHNVPGKRAVTLTTAETEIESSKTRSDGDTLVFVTDRTEDAERALITRAFDGSSMLRAVDSGAKLTVANIVLDGGAVIDATTGDNTGRSTAANGGIIYASAGDLTIAEGATLRNSATSGSGGAVYMDSNATLTLNGATISNCSAASGGGVYAEGKVTITGETAITSNSAKGNDASATSAKGNGGGVYAAPGATMEMTGGKITGNTATANGGAVYAAYNNGSAAKVTLSGGTIGGSASADANKATYGGAVFVAGGASMEMTGGEITGNQASTNGGAVYAYYDWTANKGAKVTLTGGTITANAAANGGAVYVHGGNVNGPVGATVEIRDGEDANKNATHVTITGNTAADNGAGIYLNEGSTLQLEGEPNFGGTDVDADSIKGESGNFVQKNGSEPWTYTTTDADKPRNGGKAYPIDATAQAYKVRQDIYVAGYQAQGSAANSIVVTGAIDSGTGTIWVWAEEAEHHKASRQFAVFESEAVKTALSEAYKLISTMEAFRNAEADANSDCGGDFLKGQEGEDINGLKCIYWTSSGFNVVFRKIDGNGNALPDATFTLYKADAAGTGYDAKDVVGDPVPSGSIAEATPVSIQVKVTDSGTTPPTDKPEERKLYGDGLVVFEKVPAGVYFIVETGMPYVKDEAGNSMTLEYLPAEAEYRLVVDSKGWYEIQVSENRDASGWTAKATTGSVTWPDSIPAPVVTFTEDTNGKYTFNPTTPKAPNPDTVDIFNIMNVDPRTRKVILKKVAYGSNTPLEGAHFRIFRADLSEVTEGQPTYKSGDTLPAGKQIGDSKGYYESGVSGAFWIGKLPYGTYYMEETTSPSGYAKPTKYFQFKVDDNGVSEMVETTWTLTNTLTANGPDVPTP